MSGDGGTSMLGVLRDLPATGFENLVYDLVVLHGLRNAVWRTPGTDAGRDIEGEVLFVDFSGNATMQRWYVECKRYQSTVDWPTVWKKVAYADSHKAQFLLIVTTVHLSPLCKSEVSKWNRGGRHPQIRWWDASSLEAVLLQHPPLAVRYRLPGYQEVAAKSFLSLSRIGAGLVQAAYGATVLGQGALSSLEAAAAFSELLFVELEKYESGSSLRGSGFLLETDSYDWLEISGEKSNLGSFDRYGLRAALCFIRHFSRQDDLPVQASGGQLSIQLPRSVPQSALDVLTEVAILGGFELTVNDNRIVVRARRKTE